MGLEFYNDFDTFSLRDKVVLETSVSRWVCCKLETFSFPKHQKSSKTVHGVWRTSSSKMSTQVCNWTCQTSRVCSFRTNIRVKSGMFSYRPVSTSLMNSISKLRERFLMIFGALKSWKSRVYNTLNAKRQFPKQLCPSTKTWRNRYRIRVQIRRDEANNTTKNSKLTHAISWKVLIYFLSSLKLLPTKFQVKWWWMGDLRTVSVLDLCIFVVSRHAYSSNINGHAIN